MTAPADIPSPSEFFGHLCWIDRRPLSEVIEPYRARMFEDALFSFDDDGRPRNNFVLSGRAKKNWKTTDLILAAHDEPRHHRQGPPHQEGGDDDHEEAEPETECSKRSQIHAESLVGDRVSRVDAGA